MLSHMLNHSTLPVLEQAVSFAESRHGVLAGNIANIDTPGYKTRDLSLEMFQDNLKEALEQRDLHPSQPVSPGIESPAANQKQMASFDKVKESTKHILYHDESDVSLESQVTELAKNQQMHSMAISLMTHQFKQLEAAISERVV